MCWYYFRCLALVVLHIAYLLFLFLLLLHQMFFFYYVLVSLHLYVQVILFLM